MYTVLLAIMRDSSIETILVSSHKTMSTVVTVAKNIIAKRKSFFAVKVLNKTAAVYS